MADVVGIYEIGSDDFNAFQRRIGERASKRDADLGNKPAELLERATKTGDSEFIEFAAKFYAGLPPTARATVERVIDTVEKTGDQGLRHLCRLFDGAELPTNRIAVAKLDLMKSGTEADEALVDTCVNQVLPRLRAFHEKQRQQGFELAEKGGGTGIRVQPLRRVAVYVPGGTASYPSTLMMTVAAAQAAGVQEIAVLTPAETIEKSPLTCALIGKLCISEVYRVGGAQAIAAAAIGTEKIAKVDKIVGPGNLFVSLAKQLLSGRVGIDTFAGPSEVVVLFDSSANPVMVAADLLAQAEHDTQAAAVGITDNAELAQQVQAEVVKQLAALPRKEIAAQSLTQFGALLVVPSMGFAKRLCDALAPEHCELMTGTAEADAKQIMNAGAIFVGPWAPEAFGDYNAGPNHVLPTAGAARWASALGVGDFMRQVSIIRGSQELLAANKDAAIALARAEGLEAHARSLEARFK